MPQVGSFISNRSWFFRVLWAGKSKSRATKDSAHDKNLSVSLQLVVLLMYLPEEMHTGSSCGRGTVTR